VGPRIDNKAHYQIDKYDIYAPKDVPPDLVETAYRLIKEKRQLIWDQTFKGRYINYTRTNFIDDVEYWIDYSLDFKTYNIIFTDISPRHEKR